MLFGRCSIYSRNGIIRILHLSFGNRPTLNLNLNSALQCQRPSFFFKSTTLFFVQLFLMKLNNNGMVEEPFKNHCKSLEPLERLKFAPNFKVHIS